MEEHHHSRHLVLRAGSAWLAVPVSTVRGIQSVPLLAPMPGQPLFMKGLILVDQEVIPVISLARAVDLPIDETEDGERRERLVILGEGSLRLGLETSRVLGFVDLEDEEQGGADMLSPKLAPLSEKSYMALDGWVAVSTFQKLFDHLREGVTALRGI